MIEVGLSSVWVQGREHKFNLSDVLKVNPPSQEIDNSLRRKQLSLYKADKRLREREGIEPNRGSNKRTRLEKYDSIT